MEWPSHRSPISSCGAALRRALALGKTKKFRLILHLKKQVHEETNGIYQDRSQERHLGRHKGRAVAESRIL